MNTTPVSLLQRLRRPDALQTDWTRFVDPYAPLLLAYARRLGLRGDTAADLVQDVFVVLLVKLPNFTYDPTRSFRGWLKKVTRNEWLKRKRRVALPVRGAADGELDAVAGAEPDPAEAFWEKEYRELLAARALQLMRRDFQEATWKAAWEVIAAGRDPARVAADLGLTANAVHQAKYRVLTRLRQEVDGLSD
jgi:RNA polymerase sigma-70 factor (ECF subfamily)